MKIKIKIHPTQRLAYIPKELFEMLGNEAVVVPNAHAAVFFSPTTPLELVKKSLKIILDDLELYEAAGNRCAGG